MPNDNTNRAEAAHDPAPTGCPGESRAERIAERRISLPEMATIEPYGPEPPACPFLGLGIDRRTHYTYPHPDHRCFAKDRAETTDARRQATYCLNSAFAECDRFQARERKAHKKQGPRSGEMDELPGTTIPGSHAAGTVIYVSKVGDSFERIATTYGLTVEEIAQANGLGVNAVIAEGTRLVIPLPAPSRGRPGRTAAGN